MARETALPEGSTGAVAVTGAVADRPRAAIAAGALGLACCCEGYGGGGAAAAYSDGAAPTPAAADDGFPRLLERGAGPRSAAAAPLRVVAPAPPRAAADAAAALGDTISSRAGAAKRKECEGRRRGAYSPSDSDVEAILRAISVTRDEDGRQTSLRKGPGHDPRESADTHRYYDSMQRQYADIALCNKTTAARNLS